MNPIRHPDQVDQGAILTQGEFESAAIQAQLMEDLLDRDDLATGHFLQECINRANAIRTPQNQHLWVTNANYTVVFLVRASLLPGIERMNALARALTQQAEEMHNASRAVIEAGCRL